MNDHQPQLEEAARTLIAWARTRQAGWRDPSAPAEPAPELCDGPGGVASCVEGFAPVSASVPRSPQAPARAAARPTARWVRHSAVAAAVVMAAVAVPAVWRSWAPAVVAVPAVGTLSLESTPAGSVVLIDGVEAGKTPMTSELAVGTHTVEFRFRKATRKMDVTVVGGKTAVGAVDWTSKPTGWLQVTSDVANTTIVVDGKRRGTAPLSLDGLSAGTHAVTLQSPHGSIKRSVTIKEGETVQFAGSIYPGSLHVSAPFEVQVSESGRHVGLDDKNQVVLPPGPHTLRFTSASHGFSDERTIEVQPGKVTSVSLGGPAKSVSAATPDVSRASLTTPEPDTSADSTPSAEASSVPGAPASDPSR